MSLINPKEVTLTNKKGEKKTFILSEIPAWQSREIAALYLPSAMPKVGDYNTNAEMARKMLSFVSVKLPGGNEQPLTTEEMINNHTDFKTLAELEWGMIDHNYGFFLRGTVSTFSNDIAQKVPQWITRILTALQAQSLPKAPPLSMNSEPSTPSGTPS